MKKKNFSELPAEAFVTPSPSDISPQAGMQAIIKTCLGIMMEYFQPQVTPHHEMVMERLLRQLRDQCNVALGESK